MNNKIDGRKVNCRAFLKGAVAGLGAIRMTGLNKEDNFGKDEEYE